MPEQPQEESSAGGSDGLRSVARRLPPLRHLAAGLFSVAAITLLVPSGFEARSLPVYRLGETAPKTVKAIQTFTAEDREATALKREAAARRASAVFDLDLRVNDRLEAELRHAFDTGRSWVEEERRRLNLLTHQGLPPASRRALRQRLRTAFYGMNPEAALDLLITESFSSQLEDQSVALLRSALSPPGVVAARDLLSRYRDRGISIRNTVTGRQEPLQDWTRIRDLELARQTLRQNRAVFQLGEDGQTLLAELVGSQLAPNLAFNESQTRLAEEQARQNVDPLLIQVQAGRTIVREGEKITPQNLILLRTLKERSSPGHLLGRLAGLAGLAAFFLASLRRFLPLIKPGLKPEADYFLLSCTLLVGSVAAAKVALLIAGLVAAGTPNPTLQDASLLAAAAPFALGAALMTVLGNTPLALLWSLVFALLAALMTGDLRTLVYALAGCISAVHLLQHYLQRWTIVRAGLGIGLAQALALTALQLYSSQPLSQERLLWGVALALGSGLLAVVMASLILPLLERIFGIATDARLRELANLNSPLLQRLAVEAPGTFHHSMLVGTLAEAAARSVGANPLLARAGAYYHDIGKLSQPGSYTENQIFQEKREHPLKSLESSRRQADRVRDGLMLAEESGLPTEVRNLIPQHLGTCPMSLDCRNGLGPSGQDASSMEEAVFRYPGPKPQSKEAAILMLADQVEPAVRALQSHSAEQMRGLVRRLVRAALEDGQFDECRITVCDLDRISSTFEKVLAEVQHRRVEYSGFEFSQRAKAIPVASPRLQ
ncbi:MAG: HDIG domain-containing metalloprotein [Acidobacteriota bacterium]